MALQSQIRISTTAFKEIKEHLRNGKKIQAIKHARTTGKQFPGVEREEPDADGNIVKTIDHRVGLRQAKDAVEHLAGQNQNPSCILAPQLKIKRIIVEGEGGEFEVDIDGLQLRLLKGLGTLPLSEVAAMTDLVSFIRNWQGENIE